MIVKRNIFDIADDSYLKEYFNRGFLDDKETYGTEITIYKILFVLLNIFSITSLIFFFILRKSYFIHQRNFILTFIGGIFIYLNVFIGFLPQIVYVPCFLSVFSTNILNPIANLTFLSRTLRVILFYHFNIFKVTSVKSKKENINKNYDSNIEPNNYLPKIYSKINKIISCIIIIPTVISAIITFLIYILDSNMDDECPFFKSEDALINLKHNKGMKLFFIVKVFGFCYIIISFIFSLFLLKVKDSNNYGVKFECLSVCILIFIINSLNILLQVNSTSNYSKSRKPRIIYLKLFELTKGGKILFSIVSVYMLFVSITLPVIQYYKSNSFRNKELTDKRNSIRYFYKVLNTPSLVNELREIAVNEFCVENVLFWENYQVLQKKVYRYQLEYNKSREMENEDIVNSYYLDDYYTQQYETKDYYNIENYSYDPDMPVPREILPFYISFYHIFIEANGPAVVNISRDTANRIFYQLSSVPTIGMYDSIKDEIVEVMFGTIFPILLKQNKKTYDI